MPMADGGDAALTVAICARNAAATIERAVGSAVRHTTGPILLLDDFSTDDTAARAMAVGAGDRLRVIRPPSHGTIATARTAALAAITTPLAMWLDADDEILAGRSTVMAAALSDGAGLVFDAVELVDGPSGQPRGVTRAPDFLRRPMGAWWMLERNWLPNIGWPAFRVEAVQRVGYDAALTCAEDYDMVRRCLLSGQTVAFVDHVGYRAHTYPQGLSRQIDACLSAYQSIFGKVPDADLRAAYSAAGLSARSATWACVTAAIFRGDGAGALALVEGMTEGDECTDPDGPYAVPEAWRIAFQRGTLRAWTGQGTARADLERAAALLSRPDAWNNLGVVLAREGDAAAARMAFEQALALKADYVDARLNQTAERPDRLTLHPLRLTPDRGGYGPMTR